MNRRLIFIAVCMSGLATLALGLQHQVPSQGSSVQLQSDPAAAEVWLDGKLLGTSPLSLDLPGRTPHQLELRKSGYESLKQEVRGLDGPSLNLRLSPRFATLSLEDPKDLKISLGPGVITQLEGSGPWKLLPGSYELVAKRDGIPSKVQRFSLKPGETLKVEPEWPEMPELPSLPPRPAAQPRLQPPQRPAYQPPEPVYQPPVQSYQPRYRPRPQPQPRSQPAPLWTPLAAPPPAPPPPAPAPAPPGDSLFTPL
jgi:hypothetical protein